MRSRSSKNNIFKVKGGETPFTFQFKYEAMKSRFFISVAMLLISLSAFAQYEPTTKWPYIYQDFTPGQIQLTKTAAKQGVFNIHILHGRLHFIDKELIREVNPVEIVSAKIGEDLYVNSGGKMMKVLAHKDNVFVVEGIEVDMNQLNATGGAYGSSSTTLATTALSSIEEIGTGAAAMNHMELKNSKDEGRILPLITKRYIVFPGHVIYAAKKDIMNIAGADSDETGAFMKEQKIKFKDAQSLLKLGIYLNDKVNVK